MGNDTKTKYLKPGGKLDLTVPPALKQLKMMMIQLQSAHSLTMDDFFNAHQKFSVWKFHDDLMGATNPDKSFGDSHLTLYSKNTLKPILEYVGFKIESIDENVHVKATK